MNLLIIFVTIVTLITSLKFGRYASDTKTLSDFAKTFFFGITLIVDSLFLIFVIAIDLIN